VGSGAGGDSPAKRVDERCYRKLASVLHLQFLERVEDLSVEELVTQLGVEALAVSILPWPGGIDLQRLCACIGQPLTLVTTIRSRGYSLRRNSLGLSPNFLRKATVR
jgi:hypothetical protein